MPVRLVALRTMHPSVPVVRPPQEIGAKEKLRRYHAIIFYCLVLTALLSGNSFRLLAQNGSSLAGSHALPDAPGIGFTASASESQPTATQAAAVISGTVLDTNGAVIEDAHVVLTSRSGTIERITQSGPNGQFSFDGLPAGSFKLRVTGKAMGTYVSPLISLHDDEMYIATQVVLPIASASTDVTVYGDKEELAEEQVLIAEQQRVWGVFPNFYTTFDWTAPPLGTKQKFKLALRSEIDPVTFLGIAGIAGAEQYQNIFPGYGGGIEGYAKRYGAAYANSFSGRVLSGAVFASMFHQDPRYFYKGTGSTQSRALYAISAAVIAKDDNGHWKPNYSHVLGNFAAGALSNLYYPSTSRGASLVISTGLIELAANAGNNIMREFFLKGITTHANGKP